MRKNDVYHLERRKGINSTFGEPAFFIQQGYDSKRFLKVEQTTIISEKNKYSIYDVFRTYLLHQINTLLVIYKGNTLPIDLLLFVFLLFQFEDVMVEMLLQLLIGKVDTELFKTVDL